MLNLNRLRLFCVTVLCLYFVMSQKWSSIILSSNCDKFQNSITKTIKQAERNSSGLRFLDGTNNFSSLNALFLSLDKKDLRQTGILTGHFSVRYHLKKMRLVKQDTYWFCFIGKKLTEHLLSESEVLAQKRINRISVGSENLRCFVYGFHPIFNTFFLKFSKHKYLKSGDFNTYLIFGSWWHTY